MTDAELDSIADAVAKAIQKSIAPLKIQIGELQMRQAILSAKAHVNFRGVFSAGSSYSKGDAVTRQGALWIALEDTAGVPGGNTPEARSWQLAVKSGTV
jgi:hypothetical protein